MAVAQTGGLNLSWLDEEVRREKGIVEELRNIVDKQQITIVDQAQRILSLEDRLTKMQNQLQSLPEVRQASQNMRDEVVAMMGDLRQDVQKRETEALRVRQGEREKDLRALQEVRAELSRLGPLEQAAAVNQAEDRRLNEILARQQGQIEVLSRSAAQGEEGRRLLQDAISRSNVEIQQLIEQVAELATVRQSLMQRILPLENEQSKVGQQIAELQTVRQELNTQQQDLSERQRRSDRDRAQTLTEWGRRLDASSHQIETWADQMRFYADQHEKNRAVLRDVQALAHDLSQQQDRLRQLQRVMEEQLRQELREYRVENDQRWAQDAERREQTRAERESLDDAVQSRLATVEHGVEDVTAAALAATERLGRLADALAEQKAGSRASARRALEVAQKDLQQLLTGLLETLESEG
ncbi:MAG: hypothetical protein GXX94_11495 [Chloroflexi bacterium]|nr:hypothetical protein [Chloroflexota bacterium]